MTTTAEQIAAADQYQAITSRMLDDHVNAIRADLVAGIDPAIAVVDVTTMLREHVEPTTCTMLLAGALIRLARQKPALGEGDSNA